MSEKQLPPDVTQLQLLPAKEGHTAGVRAKVITHPTALGRRAFLQAASLTWSRAPGKGPSGHPKLYHRKRQEMVELQGPTSDKAQSCGQDVLRCPPHLNQENRACWFPGLCSFASPGLCRRCLGGSASWKRCPLV